MKYGLNKKIPAPDLKRILVLVVYSVILFGATFAAWYYFAVIIPEKEASAQKSHLETINSMYKDKYCDKLPYKSDAIKRLCTEDSSSFDVK